MGAVITRESRMRIEAIIDDAARKGATILVDGRTGPLAGCEGGNFVLPTVIENVPDTAEAACAWATVSRSPTGGSGAGPDFNGTNVVQTQMTNSRLTDPEVLEWRFPVRLERYEIRPGSGGKGHWHGGDGGTRVIRFLEPMTVSILANNRHRVKINHLVDVGHNPIAHQFFDDFNGANGH
jgi:hypothetical protein